jgi:hypothetical protein
VTAAFSYAFASRAQSNAEAAADSRTLSYETVSGPEFFPDGGWDLRIKWHLSEPSSEGGWIVQEIKYRLDYLGTDRVPLVQEAHYWEAWRIEPGKSTTSSPLWWDDRRGADVKGTAVSIRYSVTANARFYEGLQLPPSFRPGSVESAGALPATTIRPNLPLRGATAPVVRNFEHKWP